MARDVQLAFAEIIGKNSGGGVEDGKIFIEKMKAEGRFLLDIWS